MRNLTYFWHPLYVRSMGDTEDRKVLLRGNSSSHPARWAEEVSDVPLYFCGESKNG
jgi:hypothetical protein